MKTENYHSVIYGNVRKVYVKRCVCYLKELKGYMMLHTAKVHILVQVMS